MRRNVATLMAVSWPATGAAPVKGRRAPIQLVSTTIGVELGKRMH